MFLRYICPKVLDHSVTFYIDISLIINGSFIVARAFYAHVLYPRLDKMCMKIYANSRYKDKSAQTVVCHSKHSSLFDFQEATLLCQPYSDCAYTQTSLHICDLRVPYDWFYHDTTQNGRSRDKCVLAHIVCNKICM